MTETKKAILVVSFGTSINEAREKTIDKIEEEHKIKMGLSKKKWISK